MAEARSGRDLENERPLSPHLQIYAVQINMAMSILHRITGAALYAGSVLLSWWLVAAASGPDYFAFVSALLASWPAKLILFGYTWALLNHMLGGVRHLIWDTGRGYDLATVDLLCWGTLVVSLGLAVVLWAYVLGSALVIDR
jgi:succinate dehydrogenase / fumarate reductase cytochrome b subunit